jgi:hypothetical protein
MEETVSRKSRFQGVSGEEKDATLTEGLVKDEEDRMKKRKT